MGWFMGGSLWPLRRELVVRQRLAADQSGDRVAEQVRVFPCCYSETQIHTSNGLNASWKSDGTSRQ